MKQKLLKFIKNNKWTFITFLVSTVIISIIYILQKVSPFGNNSLLDVDFYHQYGPLLNEYIDRIRQSETFLYSFNTGTGLPFYRNFLNYLSSPFNIILLLFKKADIVSGYSIIIMLKVIFSSTFMSIYLRKTFNKENVYVPIFSAFYTFSGYFCAYYWNIMWLDGIVFLPLIMLGINKIVDKNKPLLYVLSLATMLISNYFIGYMICIYAVMYFICYMILRCKRKIKYILKTLIMFFISSLIAGGLCAVFLLPLYFALSSISATNGGYPTEAFFFNIPNYIFNHFTGVDRTVFASDPLTLPNVYPGMFTLALIITLFINSNIKIKNKLLAITSIIVFYTIFNTAIIDYVFHAFHVPNDLPWRYSFLYVFTLVSLAFYSVNKVDKKKSLIVVISFLVLIAVLFVSYKMSFTNLNYTKTIACLILIILYLIVYILYVNDILPKIIYEILIIIICVGECVYGINVNWSIDHDIKTFMTGKEEIVNKIKEIRSKDNNLYRIEKTDYLTLNDGAWFDYYGISTFSSMAYEDVAKFQRKIGLSGNDINSYYYRFYGTPVYNTLFDIKYIIGEYLNNDYYDIIDVAYNNNVVRYNYSSSFMYVVNKQINKFKLKEYAPFYNQNEIVKNMFNINDVYHLLTVKSLDSKTYDLSDYSMKNGIIYYSLSDNLKDSLRVTIENSTDQNVYLYIGGPNVTDFTVDNKNYSITSDEYYIVDIGYKAKGTIDVEISISSPDSSYIYFYACSIDDSKFKEFYKSIKDGSLRVQTYNDNNIKGVIESDGDNLVFATIPYDEGWSVYVDDKKVKTYKVLDSYMGFNLSKGNHKIALKYYPKYMNYGYVISILSLLSIVLYEYIIRKNKKNKQKDK